MVDAIEVGVNYSIEYTVACIIVKYNPYHNYSIRMIVRLMCLNQV